MKTDIEKVVVELIEKSGVDLEADNQRQIVEDSTNLALEHVARSITTLPLTPESEYLNIWMRFANSPELPGVKQKRAALVGFSRVIEDGAVEVRLGAWYDGRIISSNYSTCDSNYATCGGKENIKAFIDRTVHDIQKRVDTNDDIASAAFLNIIEQPEVEERQTVLKTPQGLFELLISGDKDKTVEFVRNAEFTTICEMCNSDLDLLHLVVDVGRACDGILAEFAWQIARLSNSIPMLKQEAKSYAINHANGLLEPHRYEAAQTKMTGWATW